MGVVEERNGIEQLPQAPKERGWVMDVTMVPPSGQRPNCILSGQPELGPNSVAVTWQRAWAEELALSEGLRFLLQRWLGPAPEQPACGFPTHIIPIIRVSPPLHRASSVRAGSLIVGSAPGTGVDA